MEHNIFYKYQGLGNDFILFNENEKLNETSLSTKIITSLCDRRTGIGADGILLFAPIGKSSVKMTYFNADGARAETCFNGLRCIALHAVRSQIKSYNEDFPVETDAGVVNVKVQPSSDHQALVNMKLNGPVFDPLKVPVLSAAPVINKSLPIKNYHLTGTALSIGNPHFVSWSDQSNLTNLNESVVQMGTEVENSPHFPNRVNFELAHHIDDHHILMAVWERGVGKTLACGSGATATVCAGIKENRLKPNIPIHVIMAGGEVIVTADADLNHIQVTGNATYVFQGQINVI